MTWEDFSKIVRTFLLVDDKRKGTGVQAYIDQMIRAGAIDLQRFVPQLLNTETFSFRKSDSTTAAHSLETTYKFGDFATIGTGTATTVYQAVGNPPWDVAPPAEGKWVQVNQVTPNAEGAGEEGSFSPTHANIKAVWVRRWPTTENNLTKSDYYNLEILPWAERYKVLDGGPTLRSTQWPGRISFGSSIFVTDPALREDEKLLIFWEGEKHNWDDNETVLFDDKEAEAVANYVKAHLQREVDRDLKMYESYLVEYRKQRQEIHRERKNFLPMEANNLGIAPEGTTTATETQYNQIA